MFGGIKAAVARVFGLADSEAHAIVEDALKEARPLVNAFKDTVVAEVKSVVRDAVVTEDRIAEIVRAELAKALGSNNPPPALPADEAPATAG